MPAVSIIVPVYKTEKFLRKCLDSIVNQTFNDIEIIVVDDGSPDNCPSIIDEYAANDSRIIPIHKKNGGVSSARNSGLNAASGEYIFLCDSDDWMELDAVEKLYAKAIATDSDDVISDHYFWNAQKNTYIPAFDGSEGFTTDDSNIIQVIQSACLTFSRFWARNTLFSGGSNIGAPWQHFYRRNLIENNQIFYNIDFNGICDDIYFNLLFYQYAKKVSYISFPSYNYQMITGSLTKAYKPRLPMVYSNAFRILDAFITDRQKEFQFRTAYAMRAAVYLDRMMQYYYLNTNNPNTEKTRKAEFESFMNREPYNTCFQNVDLCKIQSRKMKVIIWILSHRLYRLYWMLEEKNMILLD